MKIHSLRLLLAALLASVCTLAVACSDDDKASDDAPAASDDAPADDDAPLPTPEELKKEMEKTITADNADDIADALEKELMADLEE